MYPDWPESDADLVPLPQCDGPKLKPFKFSGPRKIEFVDYVGGGAHSQVFKVKIEGEIYALKVFRWNEPADFLPFGEWPIEVAKWNENHGEDLPAFSAYSEPFNSECRAYGRLQESGYEELAIRVFGYVLINEEEEEEMMHLVEVEDDPDIQRETWGNDAQRKRFPGKRTGRKPPFRAIVKAFGKVDLENPLKPSVLKKLFRNLLQLHQLGIVDLDIVPGNLVNGRLGDFSTAMTTPNFIMTPELNPSLSPEQVALLRGETFRLCRNDFKLLNEEVKLWNKQQKAAKDKMSFPELEQKPRYNLRKLPFRDARPYTFADPGLYDWKKSSMASGTGNTSVASRKRKAPGENVTQKRLDPYPARWYYECSDEDRRVDYQYRDGVIFPMPRKIHLQMPKPQVPTGGGLFGNPFPRLRERNGG
ncbi:hypothetical protein PV08_09525 [Exophiala spinifera]|uniref:Protein kinase domain-containing protein n=1 Tax=Exophiala spinifera TaxID=91928 RepID=A0A0D2BM33_9EURO|nr:uncharacterized protein PV08_09525 [Exophiala spinifera]KIW12249.1 hypothetical protein PV08_09525 [Exophiala spinifera]